MNLAEFNGQLFYKNIESDGLPIEELMKSDGSIDGTLLVGYSGDYKPSFPSELTVFGGLLFFTAVDTEHGREPWVTDGTAGTHILKDIRSGPSGTNVKWPMASNGQIFFHGYDPGYDGVLWTSDGTSEGTKKVVDINPEIEYVNPIPRINLNGSTYFTVFTPEGNSQLWKIGKNENIATLIKDFGPEDNDTRYTEIFNIGWTELGENIYFLHNQKLWTTDGSDTGTVQLSDQDFLELEKADQTLYLAGFSDEPELWISNGTSSGTLPLMALEVNEGMKRFESIGNKLFFSANSSENHKINRVRRQLFVSDGTIEGTFSPKTITVSDTYFKALTSYKEKLFFGVSHATNFPYYKVWTSLGTVSDTQPFVYEGMDEGTLFQPILSKTFTKANDLLYFVYDDDEFGRELWKTNGNTNGTSIVNDINIGTGDSNIKTLTPNQEGLYFFASTDGTSDSELWITNDVETKIISNSSISSTGGNIEELIILGDSVLFASSQLSGGRNSTLWNYSIKSNELTQIYQTSQSNRINHFQKLNNQLFFVSSDKNENDFNSVWTMDLISLVPNELKAINEGPIYSTQYEETRLVKSGEYIYFVDYIQENPNGVELWRSDGTIEGTLLVKDLVPGINGSSPLNLTSVSNKLYFSAYDNIHGRELWVTDGTNEGTILVTDIESGEKSSSPENLQSIGGFLFFGAHTEEHGIEPWVTNGTAEGTFMISDINEGGRSSSPEQFTEHQGEVFFTAYNDLGRELWKFSLLPNIKVESDEELEITNNATLNLGQIDVSKFIVHTFNISNVGIESLTLNSFTISGVDADDFEIIVPSLNSRLTFKESISFQIKYSPSSEGIHTATLSIASNDPDEENFNITITGKGTAPDIDLAIDNLSVDSGYLLDFGEVPLEDMESIAIDLSNLGQADLNLSGTPLIEITGTNVDDFTIENSTVQSTIAPEGTSSFQIKYSPSSEGTHTATLSIVSNDPDEENFTITMTGMGTAPDIDLAIDNSSIESGHQLDFGEVPLEDMESITIDLSNLGQADLNLSGTPLIEVTGTNADDFTIENSTVQSTVAPNGTNSFQIKYTPISEGTHSATLSIASNDPDEENFTISIIGKGILINSIENFEKEGVHIYPNPVKQQLTIDFERTSKYINSSITIYGLMGNRIVTSQLSKNNSYDLDMRNIPHGIYIVEIDNGSNIQRHKILKE